MKKQILIIAILFISVKVGYSDLPPSRAKQIRTDTSNFDNNLSSADNTAQKAFETLDELTFSGTPGGNDTEFQYNNSGAFAGTSDMIWTANNVTFIDDQRLRFGSDSDWGLGYEENDEDSLTFSTEKTASTGTDNAMLNIAVDILNQGCTANQEIFEVGKGGIDDGDENWIELFAVDEDGDVSVGGDITISGGNINTGNIPLVVGDATTDSITFSVDGTGDGEIVLPNDSVGSDEINSTTGAYDFGGVISLEVPNTAGDVTCDAAGEVAVDTTQKQFVWHDGTREVAISSDRKITALITSGDWDLDSDKWLHEFDSTVYPDGIVITKWAVDANVADPSVELDANLMYCDTLSNGAFPGANATLIDVLDTTTGNSSESDMSNSDLGSGTIPTGKILYIDIDVDPAIDTNFFVLQIWFYQPES